MMVFRMRLFTGELRLCMGREMRFSRATKMVLISKKKLPWLLGRA